MISYFFIFLFGLCIGSFLNVLIYRLGGQAELGQSPAKLGGRSHCPKCEHQLAWQDLIPVLSFILLRGQCRYCSKKISWQYPIVELMTGILFVVINNPSFSLPLTRGGVGWGEFSTYWLFAIGYLLFLTSCLIVIFVSDLKYFIIPDKIIIAGSIAAFLYHLFGVFNFRILLEIGNWKLEIFRPLFFYVLAGIGASAFFFTIVLITRGRGMGLGDVKLAFLMGLILGWPKILVALLFAFISGALVGLGLIIIGRAKMKTEIPFGTFLTASTFLVMIWGDKILLNYINLLF